MDIAIIISIIALVVALMALPTVLQMFFGQPLLTLKNDVKEIDDYTILICKISNKPITKGILYSLKVIRMTAEDVVVYIQISKTGSHDVVLPRTCAELSTSDGITSIHARLPSSLVYIATCGIIAARRNDGVVVTFPDLDLELQIGEYLVEIDAVTNRNRFNGTYIFIVDKNKPYIYWRN